MSRGPQDGCAVERGHVVSRVSGPESGSGAVVVRHVPPRGRRDEADGGRCQPRGAGRRVREEDRAPEAPVAEEGIRARWGSPAPADA